MFFFSGTNCEAVCAMRIVPHTIIHRSDMQSLFRSCEVLPGYILFVTAWVIVSILCKISQYLCNLQR